MLLANFKPKEQQRHRVIFLRQHGFLVFTAITLSTVNHFSERERLKLVTSALPQTPYWWRWGWLPLPKNPTPAFGPSGLQPWPFGPPSLPP